MCITPSPVDCSHLIVLSLCHDSFCKDQQDWEANTHKHTHVHTPRHASKYTQAQTLPTATSRAMLTHNAHTGENTQHPPDKAERLPGVGRHTTAHTHTQSPALSQTHLHISLHLSPQHMHGGLEQFPHTDCDA